MNRLPVTHRKIETAFGSIYLHLHYSLDGNLIGAALSHKWKDPNAQVDTLLRQISDGLDKAVKEGLFL